MRSLLLTLLLLLLSACTSSHHSTPLQLSPANRIFEKEGSSSSPPYQLVNAKDPLLAKAFMEYQKSGIAKAIETDQFIQFPYSAGTQPVINAGILELTAISLEPGEQVNSVSSGDPLRWSYSLVYSGSGDSRQAHILVKPSKPRISTDFFITTDKRAYTLKLVSNSDGQYTREVRFWYPETLSSQMQKLNNSLIAQLPEVNLNQLNFNYEIQIPGTSPLWRPQRIFDDGIHTYIQLSATVASNELPALFIQNDGQQQLVNYRFKSPYYIVDKIFQKAMLVTGVGQHQQIIFIINQSLKG